MCDSTQGSLCPSPMTIHQCMWIQWSILQITTYIHTHTTYILHTTYRMSDHIVSYWTQFRRDKNEYYSGWKILVRTCLVMVTIIKLTQYEIGNRNIQNCFVHSNGLTFPPEIWNFIFWVMILQMKQKAKIWKIRPCTFNIYDTIYFSIAENALS